MCSRLVTATIISCHARPFYSVWNGCVSLCSLARVKLISIIAGMRACMRMRFVSENRCGCL